MSLVTHGANGRVYRRKFDHDEALARHAGGETVADLARAYGVNHTAVKRVVDPEFGARMNARTRLHNMGAQCVDCGASCVRYRTGEGLRETPRCRACASRASRTSVRDEELYCSSCKQWKPDDEFPRNHCLDCRRGRHRRCRHCLTVARRAYREGHKIPCVSCGQPRLAPNELSRNRDTGLCARCWASKASRAA